MVRKTHLLQVEGEFACFSSPMTKVERLSQPALTPSAARGILDSIYIKPPEFRWQVRRIVTLNPIRYIALRRNEVKDKISTNDVKNWMQEKSFPEPIIADAVGTDQKGRTQRQTMALRDVSYLIYAEIIPWPGVSVKQIDLDRQFERRAKNGKCFCQPCFGCREFPAYFEYLDVENGDELPKSKVSINVDLGFMVYDVFDLSRANGILCTGTINKKSPCFQRYFPKPAISVFHAKIVDNVMEIPDYNSPNVLKLSDLESNSLLQEADS